jgi:CelD/BcsL family acetyltransferase involved in cellulose biosynthesis
MTLRFEKIPLANVPWTELDSFADRTVHQTKEWLAFLAETQGAQPVILQIFNAGVPVGWFTGATVKRFGMRILGSPMRGWTTAHMGFNLVDDALINSAVTGLAQYATESLKCAHVEVLDQRCTRGVVPPGFRSTPLNGLVVDLQAEDEQLLLAMTKNGRRDVRKGLRLGVVVSEVDSKDSLFIQEYYSQVSLAFARRGLTPTYPQSRVESMVRHLHSAGYLLLLRASLPTGETAATGIFAGIPGGGASFTFQASNPDFYDWLPNEALVWQALRSWRDRGAISFDFGGREIGSPTDFKRKFGGTDLTTDWLRYSKHPFLESGRSLASRTQKALQKRRKFGSG